MSALPPQYWLEYTFTHSLEQHSPGRRASDMMILLKEATRKWNIKLLYLFKVLAEPKVIAVVQANAAHLEEMLAVNYSLDWLAHVQCLPLRSYEAFAKEVLGVDTSFHQSEQWADIPGDFYWITVDVKYWRLTQEELFKIWRQEAKAALGVMEQGTAKLFKVVAENKVMILLKMPTPDVVDNTFNTGLPLFKQLGNQVTTSCKLVLPYQG